MTREEYVVVQYPLLNDGVWFGNPQYATCLIHVVVSSLTSPLFANSASQRWYGSGSCRYMVTLHVLPTRPRSTVPSHIFTISSHSLVNRTAENILQPRRVVEQHIRYLTTTISMMITASSCIPLPIISVRRRATRDVKAAMSWWRSWGDHHFVTFRSRSEQMPPSIEYRLCPNVIFSATRCPCSRRRLQRTCFFVFLLRVICSIQAFFWRN